MLLGDEKKAQMGKDGEVPVSDASAGPSFSNDGTVDELVVEKYPRSERGMSGNESEAKRKTDGKIKFSLKNVNRSKGLLYIICWRII